MKKVLKFWAPWCGPCKQLSEKMASLGATVPIEEINVDNSPDIAADFQVRGIPTLVMVDGNKEIARISGNVPTDQLIEFLKK